MGVRASSFFCHAFRHRPILHPPQGRPGLVTPIHVCLCFGLNPPKLPSPGKPRVGKKTKTFCNLLKDLRIHLVSLCAAFDARNGVWDSYLRGRRSFRCHPTQSGALVGCDPARCWTGGFWRHGWLIDDCPITSTVRGPSDRAAAA